jgi:hypothetical protein
LELVQVARKNVKTTAKVTRKSVKFLSKVTRKSVSLPPVNNISKICTEEK